MAVPGFIAIKDFADAETGIDITLGGIQTTSPLRIFTALNALVFQITPAGNIQAQGMGYGIRTISATGPALTSDGMLVVDATGGPVNVTLPLANALGSGFGQRIKIVKKDSSTNRVAVVPSGSDTIAGQNSASSGLQLQSQYAATDLISDGAGIWYPAHYLEAYPNSAYKTNVGAYTLKPTDYRVGIDATAGAVAATLPAANAVPAGKEYLVKKIDASGNAVTITRAGADTIEGGTTIALAAQWNYGRVVSDGVSNWLINT